MLSALACLHRVHSALWQQACTATFFSSGSCMFCLLDSNDLSTKKASTFFLSFTALQTGKACSTLCITTVLCCTSKLVWAHINKDYSAGLSLRRMQPRVTFFKESLNDSRAHKRKESTRWERLASSLPTDATAYSFFRTNLKLLRLKLNIESLILKTLWNCAVNKNHRMEHCCYPDLLGFDRRSHSQDG